MPADRSSTPHSLLSLLISLGRRPTHRWPEVTNRERVIGAMDTATQNRTELQALCACYPDSGGRELRLRTLARIFEVPDHVLRALMNQLAALPPVARCPESPELGDWAWDRRRELFGR